MKRDSAQARRIVAALDSPDVTGRRLERWSAAKLLPQAGSDEAKVLAHVAALADAAPQGRDPDTVALIMAARGFGAERLPDALARVFGASSVDALGEVEETEAQQRREIRAPIDPWSDDGSRHVESLAQWLIGIPDAIGDPGSDALRGILKLLGVLMGSVVENARTSPVPEDPILPTAGLSDDRDPPRLESPERTSISAVEGLFALLLGAEPTSYAAVSRIADPEGRIEEPNPDELECFADAGRVAGALVQRVSWVPIEGLVVGAQATKLMLRWTGIDKYLGDPDRVDMIAGALAIPGIAFAPLLFSVAADAGVPLPDPTDATPSVSAGDEGASDVD